MNIKVSETRRTMAKDLLIFPETEEDSKKIYESLKKEDSGLIGTSAIFRPPRKSAEAEVEDSLSVVMKDVDIRAEEEDIEAAIMEEQGLKVKVVRFINRTSGRGIPKVKVTFEKKEEMEDATKNGGVQEEDQNSTMLQVPTIRPCPGLLQGTRREMREVRRTPQKS